MALTNIEPTQARVLWDARRGHPTRIVAGARRMRVLQVRGQRDELAAFRADVGPRITYHLMTDVGEVALVFDARRRTWHIEAIDEVVLAA